MKTKTTGTESKRERRPQLSRQTDLAGEPAVAPGGGRAAEAHEIRDSARIYRANIHNMDSRF